MSEQKGTPENMTDLKIDKIGWGKYQNVLLLVVGLGSLSVGANFGLMIILPFILESLWSLSSLEIYLIDTLFMFGNVLSYVFTIFYGDKFGRLTLLKIPYVILILTGVLGSLSPEIYSQTTMRTIIGFIGSLIMTSSSAYLLESTPSNVRGACSLYFWVNYILGNVLILLLAYLVMPDLESDKWKLLSTVAGIPATLALPGLFFYLKESPIFLMKSGEVDEAFRVFECIAKINHKANINLDELDEISREPTEQVSSQKATSKFNDLFKASLCKQNIIMVFIWILILNNFFGFFFSLPYVVDLNSDRTTVILVSILCTSLATLISIIQMITVEIKSIGRVKTISALFILDIAFCLTALLVKVDWIYFGSLGIIFGTCTAIYFALYSYTCEIYKTEIRITALSFSNLVSRTITLITPSLFLITLDVYPDSFFFIISISSSICLIMILYLNVETKDKALDTIDE